MKQLRKHLVKCFNISFWICLQLSIYSDWKYVNYHHWKETANSSIWKFHWYTIPVLNLRIDSYLWGRMMQGWQFGSLYSRYLSVERNVCFLGTVTQQVKCWLILLPYWKRESLELYFFANLVLDWAYFKEVAPLSMLPMEM